MIAYLDSSVLVRSYFADEPGHDQADALLGNSEIGLVTGTWSRIEVTGALVRAARSGRGDEGHLIAMLDADLGPGGSVSVVPYDQERIEARALEVVRTHALRAMDAWHLATASLITRLLAEPGEELAFATRDAAQAEVAAVLGMSAL